MTFDSILALTDFTTQSEHALDRAALLAGQHNAPLRLIHFAEEPHRFFSDPIARLSQRARQLTRRHGIRAVALERNPVTLDDVVQECGNASLLVMGPLWQRSWKTFYRGTTLDQFVHDSPCPVLVVKQAAARTYEQVLVAVDLTPRSRDLIAFARQLASPSALKLFHAIDTIEESKLRSADVSFEAIRANRLDSRQQAKDRLVQLTRTLGMAGSAMAFDVGNGDPAYQTAVQQQATRAELVVVGKRRASALARFLTGSVAQRLAKWAESDVLVVPIDGLAEPVPMMASQG
ncbi:MAG: universal stress protein [Hydrogenophaga sp.]|uniref:universal stress protein n=1 Tax=Hydrogenophaga sp. TaxID=1904254 RepID=UPI002614B684|nr:universal stress protein [Hydrogenophaga sp.]MCW5671215.1 universal stress protein [Hydrogenophaga sp.]